ncbi:MAG: hypothetical protein ACTHOJ_14585 [Sphingomonas oligoaromativorans]
MILTPRTGSRSLKNAIAERYPQSMLLYRHMEADGIPQGYDRWHKFGVVRDPVERLFSLYKYLQRFGLDWCQEHDETYTALLRESVRQPFESWLLTNEQVFTSPYDRAGLGRFFPVYTCRHPVPENRKSQFVYLRPDLGTKVWRYTDLTAMLRWLDVSPVRQNATDDRRAPRLSDEARDYVERWFSWDLEACAGRMAA